MKTNRITIRNLVLVLLFGLGLSITARADSTWTGTTDGNWNTAGNWSPAAVPGGFVSLTFPDVVNQTIDLQGDRAVNSLTFCAPDPFVLNNNTLLINSGPVANNGAGSVTINSAIAIWNDFNFTGTGTGTITVNGAISPNSGTKYLGLNAANLTLVLAGNNTYNGAMTISAGTLLVTGSNSSAATTEVGTGAKLVLGSSSATPLGSGTLQLDHGSWLVTADATTRTNSNPINWGHNATHNFAGPGALVLTASEQVDFASGNAVMNISNTVTFAGNLSESGGAYLTKTGPGTLVLAGHNSYSLFTILNAGTLLVTGDNSSAAQLELDSGGTLVLGSSSTAPLGTGNWSLGNGSTVLTADATTRTVGNNLALAGGANTYNIGGPGALVLTHDVVMGSSGQDNRFNISNVTTFSGNISGGGILDMIGPGTLVLSGNNTYTYDTFVKAGEVRLASANALPGGIGATGGTAPLFFEPGVGGVFELAAGDFQRGLGGGVTQVIWDGASGGFSAYGGNRIVNLGGASGAVTWNSGGFVPTGSALILGSATADSTVDFQNPINLNGAVREIRVADNPNSTTDLGKISGQLSNGGLLKTGSGPLILSANNTYAGATTVSAGTLVVNGTVGAGGLTINSGAHLGGSGTISSVIGGAGSVDPGNSPGILTVNQVNPTGGLGFNFEFTNAGSLAAPGLPDYTNPLASRNDVLRITNAVPFTAALTGANIVDLYLASAPNSTNGFYGGFYTDAGNFAGQLSNASFLVYLLTPGGPVTYNGNQYNLVSDRLTYFAVHTVNQTGPGGVNGFVTEFDLTLVPEPSVLWLAVTGTLLLWRWRRWTRE